MKRRNLIIGLVLTFLVVIVGGTYLFTSTQFLKGELGQVDELESATAEGCIPADCAAGAEAQKNIAWQAEEGALTSYNDAVTAANASDSGGLSLAQTFTNDYYTVAQGAADLARAYADEAAQREQEDADAVTAAQAEVDDECGLDPDFVNPDPTGFETDCPGATTMLEDAEAAILDSSYYADYADTNADQAQTAADNASQYSQDSLALTISETGADADGDGLSDYDENNVYFTDAANTDTDGDGLSDGDEVNTHGTDPLDDYSDEDFLTDGEEVNNTGTDPTLDDTDGDGISDGNELRYSLSDPLLEDSDSDGLSDGEEYNDGSLYFGIGTDPNDSDSDDDGLSDGVEVDFGTDPLNADTDGDGITDDEEYAAVTDSDDDGLFDSEESDLGTDPNDSDSDDDGVEDGDEVNTYGSDPLKSDTDDEGLTDGEEINTHGTSATDSDSDDDGYNDKEEIDAGTDPLDASDHPVEEAPPPIDTDGDGLSDNDENNIHKTDPNDTDTDDDGASDYDEVKAGTDPLAKPIAPPPPPPPPSDEPEELSGCIDPFTDVPAEHWADMKICELYSQDVVQGRTSTTYVPNDFMTRAEYIKVILESAGYEESDGDGLTANFTDLTGHWAYSYIALADSLGILRNQGAPFNPNGSITRADATVLLIRLAEQTLYGYTQDDIPFWDVYSTDYFAYAVIIASDTEVEVEGEGSQSVIEGYTDGSFRPYNAMSRAEVATLALRAQLAWFQ